jgi:hypothetical protein
MRGAMTTSVVVIFGGERRNRIVVRYGDGMVVRHSSRALEMMSVCSRAWGNGEL